MTFEEWLEKFKQEESYHAELVEGDHEYVVYAAWKAAKKDERKKWADWIGNKLPHKHPLYANILWGIAEAIERNNFGVIAEPQKKGGKK